MDANKLSALKRCFPALVQSLNTREILDYMIGGEHFSQDECERVTNSSKTATDKARTFLEILSKKSNEAFKCFQDALSQEQPYLANILQQRLDTIPVTM